MTEQELTNMFKYIVFKCDSIINNDKYKPDTFTQDTVEDIAELCNHVLDGDYGKFPFAEVQRRMDIWWKRYRAEIERLIEESDFDESANLYSLLSFLDTLQEPIDKWSNKERKARVKKTGEIVCGFTDGQGHFDIPTDHNEFVRYNLDELEFDTLQEQPVEVHPLFRVGDYVRNKTTKDKVLIEQLDMEKKIYFYFTWDGAAEVHSDFSFSKQDEWELIGQTVPDKQAVCEQKPVELEKEKSGWIDYEMLMGEIGLHRENCKREIQDYRESSNPTQFQEIKYHESVGAEVRLCCLIQWCKDFMFTTEEVEELGRQSKEQPVCEGLEEELVKYIGYPEENLDGKWKKKEVEEIARHFYELGRQSKPVLSDDLEKAAREYAMDDFYNGYSSGSIIADTMKNFQAGAEWGRRNLLQEIADGKTHPVDRITAAWLDNTEG